MRHINLIGIICDMLEVPDGEYRLSLRSFHSGVDTLPEIVTRTRCPIETYVEFLEFVFNA